MKKNFFLLTLILFVSFVYGQKTDKKLFEKLNEAIKGFNGDIGIYVKDLHNGKTVAINADTIFPTASIVKVPILIGVMDKINRKELDYDQELLYRDSLAYSDYDVTAGLKDT